MTRKPLAALPQGALFRTLASGRVGELVDCLTDGACAGVEPTNVVVWFDGRAENVHVRAGLIVEELPR